MAQFQEKKIHIKIVVELGTSEEMTTLNLFGSCWNGQSSGSQTVTIVKSDNRLEPRNMFTLSPDSLETGWFLTSCTHHGGVVNLHLFNDHHNKELASGYLKAADCSNGFKLHSVWTRYH